MVSIPRTSTDQFTNTDYYYELHDPHGELILRYSYIGYITQDIPLTNETVLHVELAEDLQQLSEIVVTGYSSQRRETLTSSISSISVDEIKDIPVTSADQLMQGEIGRAHV